MTDKKITDQEIAANEAARARFLELIEREGGHEAFLENLRQFRELGRRLAREEASLRQQYPDKFVAMAPGDVFVVADTLDEIVQALREKGVPPGKSVIEFLDVNCGSLVI